MTKLLTVLLNYKSRLQLIYMDDSIIRVRLNVHKALVENETEKKDYSVVASGYNFHYVSLTHSWAQTCGCLACNTRNQKND